MVIDLYPDSSGVCEAAFEQYFAGWQPSDHHMSFEDCVSKTAQSLQSWSDHYTDPAPGFERAVALANYINWSCVVAPRGQISTPMMLSSKNVMHGIWTWDTCFSSLSMAYRMPEQAWKQFFFLFTLMDSTGNFPNLTTEVNTMWGFACPQLFGWTFERMCQVNPEIKSLDNIRKLYEPLSRAVNFWFAYQDDDGDGIPQYNHPNESGMDNSTAFDMGMSAESPDLCAYLITEMHCLADMAGDLGKLRQAGEWRKRADALLDRMIKELWTGERFIARRTDDGAYNEQSRSILCYMPLILGDRLPDSISRKMIDDLKTNGQLTRIGLASEHPESPLYVKNSYWRGPVWSPPTLIISHGVRDCGDVEFAREIARRYCGNCRIHGFAENYDPYTGEGFKDSAMPWTSSIFMILMHEFLQ